MHPRIAVSSFLVPAALALAALPGRAQPAAAPDRDVLVPREYRILTGVVRAGRALLSPDPVEARRVSGSWQPPAAGERVGATEDSGLRWESAQAGEDGSLGPGGRRGFYASTTLSSPRREVRILEATGHGIVFVNGEPRPGDPYGTGWVRLPVLLREGRNELLFQAGGRLRCRLLPVAGPVLWSPGDTTLPDLRVGEPVNTWGAAVLLNATEQTLAGARVRAAWKGGRATATPVPPLPPLSARKVAFRLEGRAPRAAGETELELRVEAPGTRGASVLLPKLRIRNPDQTYRRTFVSEIDGSIQYYAVNPMRPEALRSGAPALFLSLHGAGVEAIGQADAYSSKTWGHLVAPTNRRPFGFDWEDWGRLDALEVLGLAQRELRTDPRRTYLTGHSMGGHGVWHVGATFPDRFAAIGPSAGWISFWTYAGGRRPANPTPLETLLQRAVAPSDTLSLLKNYADLGVYILHGSADDNVPAAQARTMQQQLAAFHRDFVSYEQPGAGHWWDVSDEPGADCVDWAPLFDFFARRSLPEPASVRRVQFTTASPGVSSRNRWVRILAQQSQHQPASVDLLCDPHRRRITGTTRNVARLALEKAPLLGGGPATLVLDEQTLPDVALPPGGSPLSLRRTGERWQVSPTPPAGEKGPDRYGPFKDAFRRRMLFVYGTRGSTEENAWALARARFDAETFWYRGNGSVEVLPDHQFEPAATRDRNVILYGNADTNGAWSSLLSESPVQVRRGEVRLGGRTWRGPDLACLFLRPRPDSDASTVAVITGTGPAGARLTERLPTFVSGVGLPDALVLGPEVLTRGTAGVKAAGYFGLDWRVPSGEFAYHD